MCSGSDGLRLQLRDALGGLCLLCHGAQAAHGGHVAQGGNGGHETNAVTAGLQLIQWWSTGHELMR